MLDDKNLLKTTKYSVELGAAVEDNVNPETTIYLLKNQLVEAAIFNHNLKRVISFLIWKLNVERANASIKSEMGNVLQKTVNSLEELMKKYTEKRQYWKQQLDKYDYDIMYLKNQLECRKGEGTVVCPIKPRLRKTINKQLFLRQNTVKIMDATTRCRGGWMVSPSAAATGTIRRLSGLDFTKLSEALCRPGRCEHQEGAKVDSIGGSREIEGELHEAKIEMAWNKTLSDLLIEELKKTRDKLEALKQRVSEIKESAEQAIKDGDYNWKTITECLKVRLKCRFNQ